jgi:hypothetical protein
MIGRTFGDRTLSASSALSSVQFIAFEFRSRLTRIEPQAFSFGSSLQSICLPASLEFLGMESFYWCGSLSSFSFEFGSKLTRIEPLALCNCPSLTSFSLPASLKIISPSALNGTGISHIAVEEGNCHFRVSGDFLVDTEGISVIRYFGSASRVALAPHIEIVRACCFYSCKSLCPLIFDSGPKLRRIESEAFFGCSSLQLISLPASVEFLGGGSFSTCTSLSSFTFESGSKLTRIKGSALSHCSSLKSISLPASVEYLGACCFSSCKSLSSFAFESGSKLAQLGGWAFSACSALQSICLPAALKFLEQGSFKSCESLSSLTLESESKLTRIEGDALLGCSSLEFILIPRSITELKSGWAKGSSLRQVAFESALSLRIMIETSKIDLSNDFDIKFVECDCELNFPGYSVETVDGGNGAIRLVKTSSQE